MIPRGKERKRGERTGEGNRGGSEAEGVKLSEMEGRRERTRLWEGGASGTASDWLVYSHSTEPMYAFTVVSPIQIYISKL